MSRRTGLLLALLLGWSVLPWVSRAAEPAAEAVESRGADGKTRSSRTPPRQPLRAHADDPDEPRDDADAAPTGAAAAAASAGKKRAAPGLRIEKSPDGRYRISGRPEGFDSRPEAAGPGQDRRHIIHYSQYIREPYEVAANELIQSKGPRAFVRESQAQLEQYDLLRGSPLRKRLRDYLDQPGEPEPGDELVVEVMKFSLNKLNSTPSNLFADTAFENQEIENTRRTMAQARAKLASTQDLDDAIAIAVDAIPPAKTAGERGEFGEEHRRITRQLIQACQTRPCVDEVLEDVEFSTTLDLPKAPGQAEVNQFALRHMEQMRRVRSGEIPDGSEALRAVFDLNKMPARTRAAATAPGANLELPAAPVRKPALESSPPAPAQ